MDEPALEPKPQLPSENELRSRRRAVRWRRYGWSVIALMGVMILLNVFDAIPPEANRYLLPAVLAAYAVYVIFRKR